jgi:hypothetical protein
MIDSHMTRTRKVSAAFVCALVSACASASDAVRDRASYDFDCPKDQVETVPIDTLTIAAHGCGKKSVYVSNGHIYVRNAEISPDR